MLSVFDNCDTEMFLVGSTFFHDIGETELLTVQGKGLYMAEEGKEATFVIDTHGLDEEPFVKIEGMIMLLLLILPSCYWLLLCLAFEIFK